jgi:hypothetical protein
MIEQLNLDGRVVWKKTPDKGRRRVRTWLLNTLFGLLDTPCLKFPPGEPAKGRLHTECQRLQLLHKAGVPVPVVLSAAHDHVVLSDMGEQWDVALLKDKTPDPLKIRAGFDALLKAHARGQYLGQLWPRNMTLGPDGVGFVDFEEDPGPIMSLPCAQARDWVFLITGLVGLGFEPQLRALLPRVAGRIPRSTRRELQKTVRNLSGLLFLARFDKGKSIADSVRVLQAVFDKPES